MRLVYIALGWTAGIVVAANNDASPPLIWLGLVIMSVVALWLAGPGQRMGMVALVAFMLGGLRFALYPETSDITRFVNSGGLTIEGVVVNEPDIRDDRVQLQLATESVTRAGQTIASDGLVLVQAPRTADVRYGDRITATGILITPGESDTFSYADFLARSGVFAVMRNAAIEVQSRGYGSALYTALLDLKARAQDAIRRHLPDPQAALLSGILLGNERGIAPEISDAFSAVGASHVVAISGFNMAIVSEVVMRLLAAVRVPRRWAAAAGIAVITIYTLFVGANTAVVRAAIMSSLLVIGKLFRRKTYVPASLALVALLMSLQNPTVLWDVSFQLSLFAVLGLTLFSDPLSTAFDQIIFRIFPRATAVSVSGFLAEPLIVTLAAQIMTLPLIVLYFGRLSPASVVVNLLIIPPQAPLLIIGGLATLLAWLPGVVQFLYWVDLILLSWTISVVRLFARLPFADVQFHVDPRLIALFFAIVIGGALMGATQPTWALSLGRFIRQRAVAAATLFAGISTFILIGAVALSRPDNLLHVWFLDVGHSNAILVQTPRGAHMLVDGGRFPSRLLTAIGDRLPFIDREIEVLVITQPDEFDTGALTAVLGRYDIGVALVNHWQNLYQQTTEPGSAAAAVTSQPINLSEWFIQLQAALTKTQVVAAIAGYSLDFSDGVKVEVLHPQEPMVLGDSLDETALVLRLIYGDISFLLTSDLSTAGQEMLLGAGRWPQATVLQLPQHGTTRSLSTDFLQAVQPQVIVLQSDRANPRGDPDMDVLALLGDVPLFRTDEGSTVHLWTDGSELWVVQEA